ncbi:MAG TPA: polyphosphate kinase 1 [Terriglobales bacterium]|nr:polyphosphate kinase 1 [Terriglobales bacterium]
MAKRISLPDPRVTPARNARKKPDDRRNGGDRVARRQVAIAEPAAHLDDPKLFVNRELSLLEFQKRVLEEAQDETVPLMERVKFLSIVGSNLDEFFMVRVAGLKRQAEGGVFECGPDSMTPSAQLTAIRSRVTNLFEEAHECWQRQILPALAKAGIEVADYSQLSSRQRSALNKYFRQTLFPTLTPLAFDPGRPFPHISNLSLNLAVLIRDKEGVEHFARVKIPNSIPQLVAVDLPREKGLDRERPVRQCFVWLDQLIVANLGMLFPGMKVLEAHPFHVTRDADAAIQELEAADLLESVEEGVWQRRFADVIRLEVNQAMPPSVLEILIENLEVNRDDVYQLTGPLALVRLKYLLPVDRLELKDPPFVPATPAALQPEDDRKDIFTAIRRQDILLHHPFDSFQSVLSFLQQAARDPAVLAIKITLYRVGRNSPVVEALLEAIENDKQVAVLLELKARFDEESNIEWARALEREGVHVVYGLQGLKVHCKTALVVRQEGNVIRRYVHLSTGNYNTITSQLYTDFGMFTCNEEIGADCTDLFNYLTGYSAKAEYRKLLVAPIGLREQVERLIQREIEHQRQGERGHLIFKMNALVDKRAIRLLYEASQAGVQVDLLVRGICCLRPGIKGISENIKVISIVGRFLEHSRIYYFRNAGQEEVYLGSADLMPRNLNRRVEVVFPVGDPKLICQLRDEVLATYLADEVKARHMQPNGTYSRSSNRTTQDSVNSQQWFIDRAVKHSSRAQAPPLEEASRRM